MSILTLSDLNFTDLYLRLDQKDKAKYLPREKGRHRHNRDVPDAFEPVIERVMLKVNEILQHADGAMEFDGIRLRISRQHMADGQTWACLRRINTEIPDIEKLGIAPHILNHIRGLGLRDGLILISGATGQGKTTTAAALLADFLRRNGGTAVTIEDPVEFMMKGRHGEGGYCFQVEVEQDEDWAICLKRALRWAPRYIFVGEIRTPKAAEQLLRAATTGHMVITTVHAGAPEEALMGLTHLAEQAMGPGVENILAAGLTALIYQNMAETGPYMRYLYTEENSPGDPIRALIRDKKIGMITTYVEKIAAKLTHAHAAGVTSVQPSSLAGKRRI
ncbi:MAG: ATPase, T2SS/T4P/T4SS family [Alphaproteobacteria bacterium]